MERGVGGAEGCEGVVLQTKQNGGTVSGVNVFQHLNITFTSYYEKIFEENVC